MTRTILSLFWILLLSGTVIAGPGHDHGGGGHDEAATTALSDVPRLESAGTDLELVATAEGHRLTIYLDRLATNEPVEGATIEVAGDGIPAAAAQPLGDGVYVIDADWLDEPGTKALIFTVIDGSASDLLNGTLDVHAATPRDDREAFSASDILAQPMIWAIAALAAAFGFALAFAFRPLRLPPDATTAPIAHETRSPENSRGHLRQAAEMIIVAVVLSGILAHSALAGPGHDHGDGGHAEGAAQPGGNAPRKLPEGDVFVPKPSQRLLRVRTTVAASSAAQTGRELIGTVISEPASEGRVQAPMDGSIELAANGVSFVGQSVEVGDVLAMLSPSIPVFDRGSLQQLTAEVEGKLRIAEQKLSRLTRIAGVVAQRDIDDTKAELDALREQKRVLAPKNAEKIVLKAPVSGVISVASVRAGQVVNARDTLFEIVDPKKIWVEAIGIAGHEDGAINAAHAIDAQGHKISLSFVGQAPTLRQQGKPLLFKVEDAHDSLSIGSPVKVMIQRGAPVEGVVLPEDAVVRGLNGLPQVWAKISAERFKPTPVRTAPLDGSRVLVTGGIKHGARIVTEGAEFINQVR